MKRTFVTCLILAVFYVSALDAEQPAPRINSFETAVKPLLQQYCIKCHGPQRQKADLRLDQLSPDLSRLESAETWHSVLEALNAGDMPPEDENQPPSDLLQTTLASLSEASTIATEFHSNRKRTIRRMNRREYVHTINDLLGVQIDPSLLPVDTPPAHGFDTYGSSLAISPHHLIAYMESGRHIAKEFMRLGAVKPGTQYREKSFIGVSPVTPADRSSRVKTWFHAVPWPGEYKLRYTCWVQDPQDKISYFSFRKVGGFLGVVSGTEATPQVIEIPLSNRYSMGPYHVIHRRPNDIYARPKDSPTVGIAADAGVTHIEKVEVVGTAGNKAAYDIWGPLVDYMKIDQKEKRNKRGGGIVLLSGEVALKGSPPDEMASPFFYRLLDRISRGDPVSDDFHKRMISLFNTSRRHGATFGESLIDPIAMALASPQFIYLSDYQKEETLSTDTKTRGIELAHRWSYLIWGSSPDEELLSIATNGELHHPQAMSDQFDRIIADRKFNRFVEDFCTQWLELQRLDLIAVNTDLYPGFHEEYRGHYKSETIRFISECIEHDLPVRNLVDSDFVMANNVIAYNYGLPPVQGNEFTRISLPRNSPYGGLLTQASTMAINSDGTTTSPIERGVWVLRKLLDDSPAPPPANITPLEASEAKGELLSKRELLARHREAAECAVCHDKIDPLGYGLEAFDILGRIRTQERRLTETEVIKKGKKTTAVKIKSVPLFTEGHLEGYGSFSDSETMKAILVAHEERVAKSYVKALFSYALGRPVGFADQELIEQVVSKEKGNGYGMRALLYGVFSSDEICRP